MAKNYQQLVKGEYDGFVNQDFDNQNDITNAEKTVVDYDVKHKYLQRIWARRSCCYLVGWKPLTLWGQLMPMDTEVLEKNWITEVSSNNKKGGFIEISYERFTKNSSFGSGKCQLWNFALLDHKKYYR